jgi:AraC family transcriptional regulator of adaptative response / DNA-3-methyladenine glycosylase II
MRTGTKGEIVILLRYRPPYDWEAMASFLAMRAIPGIEAISERRYARTIDLDGARGTVLVEPTSSSALRATVRFPRLASLPTIIARLRRVFDLAADPIAIGSHLAEDPLLAPLIAARPGLRVPGAWDGFELAVRAVLGQQVTVGHAVCLAGKLVARFGERLAAVPAEDAGLTHVFPRPDRLVSADLTVLGMPRARASAVTSLAAAVENDPLVLGWGRSLSEYVQRLRDLPGIGDWTAEYIAMREMREPDAFPAADVGLRRALQTTNGARPTVPELVARAERWRPWRAYAAQHLWTAEARKAATSQDAA